MLYSAVFQPSPGLDLFETAHSILFVKCIVIQLQELGVPAQMSFLSTVIRPLSLPSSPRVQVPLVFEKSLASSSNCFAPMHITSRSSSSHHFNELQTQSRRAPLRVGPKEFSRPSPPHPSPSPLHQSALSLCVSAGRNRPAQTYYGFQTPWGPVFWRLLPQVWPDRFQIFTHFISAQAPISVNMVC